MHGHFQQQWIENINARDDSPLDTVEDWLDDRFNADDAYLDEDGHAFVDGRWLTQDECDEVVEHIDMFVGIDADETAALTSVPAF